MVIEIVFRYYDKMQIDTYNEWIAPHFIGRGRKPPTFEEFRYNASLVLVNSHISMGEGLRLPHNYKPVGGYHVDENIKPLPEVGLIFFYNNFYVS